MKTNRKQMMTAAEGGAGKASGGVLVRQKLIRIKAAWAPLLRALAVVLALAACGSAPEPQNASPQLPPIVREFLDKGIAAENEAQFGIALYWYYNAETYSPRNMPEAKQRREALEAKIKSGNPWGITAGNSIQVELEIEQRWPALREQTRAFLEEHSPFLDDNLLFEFVLAEDDRSSPIKTEGINRDSGTADISAEFRYELNEAWSLALEAMDIKRLGYKCAFLVQGELINGNGKVIAASPQPKEEFEAVSAMKDRSSFNYGGLFITDAAHTNSGFHMNNLKMLLVASGTGGYLSYFAHLQNWGTYGFAWNNTSYSNIGVDFLNVPIADITDSGMKARITKVYLYGAPGPIDNPNLFQGQPPAILNFKVLKTVEISENQPIITITKPENK